MRLKCIAKAAVAFALFLIAVPGSLSAQPGIEGGYLNAMNKIRHVGSRDLYDRTSMNGFFVGASDDVMFFSGFGIHTGLYYSYLRDLFATEGDSVKLTGVDTNHSFSIPLHLKMSFQTMPKMKVFLFVGPSLHFNFLSDARYSVFLNNKEVPGSITYNYLSGKISSKDIDGAVLDLAKPCILDYRMNWFDASMGVGFGVTFADLFEIRFGYDWGLVNRFKKGYEDALYCRTNKIQLSVGFRF